MMHPLLHLIAKQPTLLADHAEAYAELVGQEVGAASVRLKRRTALYAAMLSCLSIAVTLGGVALMLWAVTPPEVIRAPWALFAAPIVPLAASIVFWLTARNQNQPSAFDNVRRQVKADVAMLREASAA